MYRRKRIREDKPWFKWWFGELTYLGRFSDCKTKFDKSGKLIGVWGRPDEPQIYHLFKPITELATKVKDEKLRDEILEVIDEMEDALDVYHEHERKMNRSWDDD